MLVCLDLETTGLDKKQDKIIEIGLVKFQENTFEIIDTFSTFVNPGCKIPDLISNITNIYDSDVENAPSLGDIKNEILDFIGDCPLLGHNVFFDRDFFIENGIDVSQNILIDTFFLANFLCIYEKSLNLEYLCTSFGIGFSGAHRALNDVHATIKLFEKLLGKFSSLSSKNKKLLHYVFSLCEDKNVCYLSDLLLGEQGPVYDFGDFEGEILTSIKQKIHIDENVREQKIKKQKIATLFGSLGSVEKRENQLKMSELIDESLSKRKKLVIEAPTGLGKSFAYLIPSIQHAVLSNEKVFISTKTKNLQDQLFEKDLQFLEKNLSLPFLYSKLKGKGNYISTKAFFDELLLRDPSYTQINFLLKITLWLQDTEHGELDELNYFGAEYSYLKYINSDNFNVLSEKNPYKNHEFLVYARYKSEISDIVVINHSLLFSDLHSEGNVLGTINNLIIDEAHNIEDSVTESVKQRISEKSIYDILDTIENILQKKEIKKIDFSKNKELFCTQFDLLMDYASSYAFGKNRGAYATQTVLVGTDFFGEADISQLSQKLLLSLLDIVDFLSVCEEYDFSREINFLNKTSENIQLFLKQENTDFIKTVFVHEKHGVSLDFTLLNPGKYLDENLWTGIDFVLLTSATLQISQSFDYIKKILHLNTFHFYIFESDFDYSKQATLFIPNDLGSIKNNNEQIIKFLGKFYSIVRGKTLTLLTSFTIIKRIYTELHSLLSQQGIQLHSQGVGGSKSKLLNFYLEDAENSILLGTDSFWEGVDIPGSKLKYLVIHKFPFMVPNDPVFQARSIFFDDPFSQYSIPKAIIKLKQGFGRLIRNKSDTGVVVLLDDRIYSSSWGKDFLHAFPENIHTKYVSSENFLDVLHIYVNRK